MGRRDVAQIIPKAVEDALGQHHLIWEQKAVGLIYDHYLHNVRTHTSLGEHYGRDEVVTRTVQHLAAFPDLRLRSEAVIWDIRGEYISHWATRVAHNTGYTSFGAPTLKRVRYPVVTDLKVREGRVLEVWEVQDGLLLAKQLGFSVREAVAVLADSDTRVPAQLGVRSKGQLPPDARPRPVADETEALVRWTWHEVWNRRRLDRIAEVCTSNYRFFGPSGRRFHSRDGFTAYVLGLLAAFPDATVQLEHVTSLETGSEVADSEPAAETHVAVRWRLTGTHDGPGYGVPTGRSVNLLGITHHRLRAGQFLEEKTLFDELALLIQLYTPEKALEKTSETSVPTSAAREET